MGIIIPKEIEELGAVYEIEVGALSFLAERLGLIPILHNMAPVLHHYFPDAPLRLQTERDPETGRIDTLWASVEWAGDADDWQTPREQLDAFDRAWWHLQSPYVRRQIAVDYRIRERAG